MCGEVGDVGVAVDDDEEEGGARFSLLDAARGTGTGAEDGGGGCGFGPSSTKFTRVIGIYGIARGTDGGDKVEGDSTNGPVWTKGVGGCNEIGLVLLAGSGLLWLTGELSVEPGKSGLAMVRRPME